MNGNLQMTGFYWQSAFRRPGDSLLKEGLFKYYDENGNISSMRNYRNNMLFGESTTFYPDGSVHRTATYNKKGRLEGDFTVYYPDGKVRRLDHHAGGKFRDGKCYTSAGSDTTWFAFETMPEYPGGEAGRLAFLTENMVYPKAEQDMGIQGTVILSFVVQSDGCVKNVSLVRGVSRSLDIEAIRVTQAMPRWKPGMLDGKPVNVIFNMPVYFRLR
jgi:TonB family protein